jgi:hypothetical protein
MRRPQTLVALLAVVLASLSALPMRGRLVFAGIAILLLLLVTASLLRTALANRRRPVRFDPYERAERIREERNRRRLS